MEIIDAIGIEDLFTDGNSRQSQEHVDYVTGFLKDAREIGKPVFLIEYGQGPSAREHSIKSARSAGLILLLTDRNLTTLGTTVDTD